MLWIYREAWVETCLHRHNMDKHTDAQQILDNYTFEAIYTQEKYGTYYLSVTFSLFKIYVL